MKDLIKIFVLIVGMFTFPTLVFVFGLSTWSILLGLFASTFLLTSAMLSLAEKNN